MITFKNVSKVFEGREVLSDLSLEINKNEFVSIIGPSGAGKTTVLNLMGLLMRPDGGSVEIAGVENPSPKAVQKLRRYNFGYIFQNFVLMENETVLENLKLSKKYNPNWTDQLVNETIELVGLNETFLKKKVYQLSGGEQQRIAIARVLLKPCDIILADEPTGNLDAVNKEAILAIFKKLKSLGKTVVCVTHDPSMAEQSDRIIQLQKV